MGYGFCDGAVAYSMYVGNLKCFGIQGLRGPGIQGDPLCGSRFAEATPARCWKLSTVNYISWYHLISRLDSRRLIS